MKRIFTFLFINIVYFSYAQYTPVGTPPSIEWGIIHNEHDFNINGLRNLKEVPNQNVLIGINQRVIHLFNPETGVIINSSTTNNNPTSIQDRDIEPTADGGFIRLGNDSSFSSSFYSTYSIIGFGGNDAVLIKYDSNLNVEWVKNYGGSGGDTPYKVRQTSDGGYIFVGSTTSDDGQLTGIKNYGNAINYYIVKTDSLGTMEWTKTYGGNNITGGMASRQYNATNVIELADGNFLVGGTMASQDGDVTDPKGGNDIWVLKLDTEGDIIWKKNYGGSAYDGMKDNSFLLQLSNGEVIIVGSTVSADGDVSVFHGTAQGFASAGIGDVWLIKINPDTGDIIWEKTVGGIGADQLTSHSNSNVIILPDSNLLFSFSSEDNNGNEYRYIAKVDVATSDVVWQRAFGYNHYAFKGWKSNPDGSLIVWYYTQPNPTGNDFDPSFTTVLDPDGRNWIFKLAPCPLFTTAEPVAICEGGSYDFYGTEITETGTYTHTIEGENCDEIVTLTVTVNPLPELSVETPAVTICEGETAELIATAVGGVTVNWYATADATEVLHTGSTYTTPPLNNSTTYFVEAVSEAECASARTEVVVTVNPRPELSVEAASVCEGNSTELTATVAEGVTVNWYATADATEVLHTGTTYTTPPLNNSTTYYVEAVSSESCISERLEVTVTVNPSPELTVTQTAIEVCEGNPVVLTADVETGNMAIWYDSEEAAQWIGTGEEFSIEDLEPGTYSYWAEAYNPQTHCVSERIEVIVTVLPAPVLEAETAYTICEGNDAVLYAYSEGNVIFWYENQDDTEYLYHGNNFIIEGLAEGTHTYWVEAYTVETGCASERTEVTVTVNPVPDAPIVVEVYQAEPGQTLADLEEDIEAEGELTWYADAALTTELPNTTVVEDGAVYYVTQTVNGCESEAAAVNVEMLGTSDVNSDDFAYYPNPVSDKLNFTGSDKVESVQIYDLNGRLLLNQNGQDIRNVNVAQLSAGTYIVRVKAGKELKTFKIIKK